MALSSTNKIKVDNAEDEYWMTRALRFAERGGGGGEVPVGALVVRNGQLIGAGCNRPISGQDPTAPAEIMALRAAAANVGNYRLPGATVYVTLEPCMMCAGALVHSRISRLVYGASEPKAGVVDSHPLLDSEWLNHSFEVTAGVLGERCGLLLSQFFSNRRAEASNE